VATTTTSLRQSKGKSLAALADAVTNRLLSEPPNATTQQPAVTRIEELKTVHSKCNLFAFSSASAYYLQKI